MKDIEYKVDMHIEGDRVTFTVPGLERFMVCSTLLVTEDTHEEYHTEYTDVFKMVNKEDARYFIGEKLTGQTIAIIMDYDDDPVAVLSKPDGKKVFDSNIQH